MGCKERWRRRGILVCAVGMLVCAGLFVRQWREYRKGAASYEKWRQEAVAPLKKPTQQIKVSSEEEMVLEKTEPQTPPLQVDFAALEGINAEVTGWLYSPDTVISYPVVQGEDNTYYLDHLLDGSKNSAGTIFIDSRCQGLDGKNTILYGHHMKNGTMFASLQEYQSQQFYEAHPVMYFITPEGTWEIQLFSAYVADGQDAAWQMDFSSEAAFGQWLEQRKAQSCFQSSLQPSDSDQVITLSTCDGTIAGARFVCHGIIEKMKTTAET